MGDGRGEQQVVDGATDTPDPPATPDTSPSLPPPTTAPVAGPGELPPLLVTPTGDAAGASADGGDDGERLVVPPVVLVVVAVMAIAVTFGPWLAIGASSRTSYDVIRAAERLDVLSGTAQRVVRTLWSFLPLLGALIGLAVALGRARIAVALAVGVGLVEAGLALLVMQSPQHADWGATAGLLSGLALVVTATVTWPTRSTR